MIQSKALVHRVPCRTSLLAAGTLALLAFAPATATSPPRSVTEIVIDDFTTGAYDKTLRTGAELATQAGSMVGGYRRSHFILASSQYGMDSTLRVHKSGHLALAAGPGVAHRLELSWGLDPDGGIAPLNLDLSANDRFEIDFEFLDQLLNFNLVLFCGNGARAQASMNILPQYTPTTVELDFDDFVLIGDFSFTDVDLIVLVAQTSGPYFSHDYVISKVAVAGSGENWATRANPESSATPREAGDRY